MREDAVGERGTAAAVRAAGREARCRFLFRAWNPRAGRLQPVQALFDNGHLITSEGHLWNTPDIVVMQCTGVTDRNRKLIYEGDIVEAWDQGQCGTFEVRWRGEGGGAPLWLLYPAWQHGQFWHIVTPHDKGVIVLGNIYENPEKRPAALAGTDAAALADAPEPTP